MLLESILHQDIPWHKTSTIDKAEKHDKHWNRPNKKKVKLNPLRCTNYDKNTVAITMEING